MRFEIRSADGLGQVGIFVLFFSCIYVLKLSALPVAVPLLLFLLFLILLAVRLSKDLAQGKISVRGLSGSSVVLIFLQLLSIALLFFSFSLYDAKDPTLITGQIILLIFFCVSLFLVDFVPPSTNFLSLLQGFTLIATIQALTIIASFLVPSVRELIGTIADVGFSDLSGGNWRLSGMSGLGGSTLSLIQGIGLFVCLYLLVSSEKPLRYLVCTPLLLLSIMFTGKSGFLAIPLFLFFLVTSSIITLKLNRTLIRTLTLLLVGIPLVLFLFYLLYANFFYQETVWGGDALYGAYRRATQEYMSILSGGGSRTFSYVTSGFTLPTDIGVLLIGNLDSWELNRYSDVKITDNGYLRILWGYGLIGSILLYLIPVIMMFISVTKLTKFSEKLLLVLIYIWLFLMNIKEPYLIMPCVFFIIATVYFVLERGVTSIHRRQKYS